MQALVLVNLDDDESEEESSSESEEESPSPEDKPSEVQKLACVKIDEIDARLKALDDSAEDF